MPHVNRLPVAFCAAWNFVQVVKDATTKYGQAPASSAAKAKPTRSRKVRRRERLFSCTKCWVHVWALCVVSSLSLALTCLISCLVVDPGEADRGEGFLGVYARPERHPTLDHL